MKKLLLVFAHLFIWSFATQAQPDLFGLTLNGGSNGGGTIINYQGTPGIPTAVKNFDAPDGKNSNSAFLKANNDKLYGMTSSGGSANAGEIFSFDPATSTYNILHTFNSTDGADPLGSLMQAGNGKLYGMTSSGGTHSSGVLFSYDILSAAYTVLFNFDNTTAAGGGPSGSLIQSAVDGKLYGMALYGGSNYGVIFSYDIISNTYYPFYSFDGAATRIGTVCCQRANLVRLRGSQIRYI